MSAQCIKSKIQLVIEVAITTIIIDIDALFEKHKDRIEDKLVEWRSLIHIPLNFQMLGLKRNLDSNPFPPFQKGL